MAQILATIFLILIIAGVGKMVYDVQMSKFKDFFTRFLNK
jgi:hypothetical protein